jgi:hypothetical protein
MVIIVVMNIIIQIVHLNFKMKLFARMLMIVMTISQHLRKIYRNGYNLLKFVLDIFHYFGN